MRARGVVGLFFVCAAFVLAPGARAAAGDDTAWLQARLDTGGTIELPKLPGGRCYETRGLWVSQDDTNIDSDGACLVALGPGETRLTDGPMPRRATAVFFISTSSVYRPDPVRVRISGVRVIVPASKAMAGIDVFGHEVTLDHVQVAGAPTFDVVVGGPAGGTAEHVSILDSSLGGGRRGVVRAFGALGLDLERSTLSAARGPGGKRQPAGLLVRPADRAQPTLDVRVVDNTITGNAGAGVLLDLETKQGPPLIASDITVARNRITHNGDAGIVVIGGQRDGKGAVSLAPNALSANGKGSVVRIAAAQNTGPRLAPWRPSPSMLAAAGSDDTAWLQARVDHGGGTIFLPALDGGRCYATRGLWVSHDDTTITSNGACIVSLGPGPVRLKSSDGDPIASDAVFFVNRSNPLAPAPVGMTISNLTITVPAGQRMNGVSVSGHEVTLSHLTIGGAPMDDVGFGGRANGDGYAIDVALLDSTLSGAGRNAVSAVGVIGLRIERNTIYGVRDEPPGGPGAGIDVEPDARSQPTLDVQISGNTIRDNAGPGLILSLDSNSGNGVVATNLEISDNTVLRNSDRGTTPTHAGIAIIGGQDDGHGTLGLSGNTFDGNDGPPLLFRLLRLDVQQSYNVIQEP